MKRGKCVPAPLHSRVIFQPAIMDKPHERLDLFGNILVHANHLLAPVLASARTGDEIKEAGTIGGWKILVEEQPDVVIDTSWIDLAAGDARAAARCGQRLTCQRVCRVVKGPTPVKSPLRMAT